MRMAFGGIILSWRRMRSDAFCRLMEGSGSGWKRLLKVYLGEIGGRLITLCWELAELHRE